MLLLATGIEVWAVSNSMLADSGKFAVPSVVVRLANDPSGSALVGYMVVVDAASAGVGLEFEVVLVEVLAEFVFFVEAFSAVFLGATVAGVGGATPGAKVEGLTK